MVMTRIFSEARSRATGKRHADDAALRGGIGGLADLAVEGRDAGGVDADAALFADRRRGLHALGEQAEQLNEPIRLTLMMRVK